MKKQICGLFQVLGICTHTQNASSWDRVTVLSCKVLIKSHLKILFSILIIHLCKGLIPLGINAERPLETTGRLESLKDLSGFFSCTNRRTQDNDFYKSEGIYKLS